MAAQAHGDDPDLLHAAQGRKTTLHMLPYAGGWPSARDGRKTSRSFSTFTFQYENESKSGKVGHKNEYELTEY